LEYTAPRLNPASSPMASSEVAAEAVAQEQPGRGLDEQAGASAPALRPGQPCHPHSIFGVLRTFQYFEYLGQT